MEAKEENKVECDFCNKECVGAFECWDCNGTGYVKQDNDFITSITGTIQLVKPLELRWKPKEDITTYELAMCLPYLATQHPIMPYMVNETEPHMRHFEIIDHNKS